MQPTDRMVFGAKLKDVFTGSFPRASHQPAPLCTDACCYWFLSMHFLMNQSYLCSIQISAFFVKGLIYHQSYCSTPFSVTISLLCLHRITYAYFVVIPFSFGTHQCQIKGFIQGFYRNIKTIYLFCTSVIIGYRIGCWL